MGVHLKLLGAAAVLAATITGTAGAAPDDGIFETTLVSRASGVAGATADSFSELPDISDDGRFVAYGSLADTLDPDSDDSVRDVFARNLQTNDTILVSRATGAAGAVGDGGSNRASISEDGRYVAFESDSTNLDGDSNDAVRDVFVRDLQTNTTTLVSRATGLAGAVSDASSGDPSISADGRFVAFSSDGTNLDGTSNDGVQDVFVRDLQSSTTTLVSRATGVAGAVGDARSLAPSVSADGRYVAFGSDGTNLDADSNDGVEDVFVRDLQANTTTLASRATGAAGAVGDAFSTDPAISADGSRVAFTSDAMNIDTDSSDAEWDVFVRDLGTNTTTLASRATGAAGAPSDGQSSHPAISADGRYVAFDVNATNIDPDATGFRGVFVRDTQAQTTTFVVRASGTPGVAGDGSAFDAALSEDGRYVAFASTAENLAPEPDNGEDDIFVREVFDAGTPPADPPAAPQPQTKRKLCKKLLKKRKLQKRALANADSAAKRARISANQKDTRERLRTLRCRGPLVP